MWKKGGRLRALIYALLIVLCLFYKYPLVCIQSLQIGKVIKSHPCMLNYNVEARLEPHAEWLEREGLTTRAKLGKVIAKAPQVRRASRPGELCYVCQAVQSRVLHRNKLKCGIGCLR